MTDISLNASMRSNLLSLQQISKLQDRTQLRLSTGLKVNSAIDNPSSYYTAQSLTNRADDLTALLDAMGQGVQTIKAANEGIEAATELLEQMEAIVGQVSTGGAQEVPDKAYFIKEVGTNGAVVSTAEELRDAVNSGKETICVYGNIDLGDISTSGGLQLQENQKLVGVNYFGNFKDGMEFSSISATDSIKDHALIDIRQTGCLVSDLSFNYENDVEAGSAFVIRSYGTGVVTNLQNLNIVGKFSDNTANNNIRGAISSRNGATANIKGTINIEILGNRGMGICTSSSTTILEESALVNIKAYGQLGYGIYASGTSRSNTIISSNIKINTTNGFGIGNESWGNNHIYITSSAKIHFNTEQQEFRNGCTNIHGSNILEIASGAKIAIEKNGATKWYEVKEDYRDENTSTSTNNYITAANIETKMKISETTAWQTAQEIIEEGDKNYTITDESDAKDYQSQFNNALSQFDMLINDSSYKGVNLLKDDSLKINFNEDKSAHLLVKGVDVTSESLGLLSADWREVNDVSSTLEQLSNAKNKLRSAASQLGNYYSIVTTRDEFTENLINVLEEGADKLTLADMNEESANMLSLQIQQQLAINSLSLASQASQAVLRLF